MVQAIDALGDLLGVPRLKGVPVPHPFPISAIDASLIGLVAPRLDADDRAAWAAAIADACVQGGMDNIRRVAAFIAQMSVESQGFTRLNESLNYSVDALLSKFGRDRISAADARRLGRKPGEPALPEARQREIANLIYGGDFGRRQLGNTQPEDGWIFRGFGPPQITGRGNASRFAQAMGMRLDEALAYGRTLAGGIAAAAWFWKANGMNALADTPGVLDETLKLNGGTNALAERQAAFDKLVAELLRRQP